MYPYLRMFKEVWNARKAPPLGLFDTHISRHMIWPVDLDPWRELNNGRTLTLYDLGRIPLALRTGLVKVMRQNHWGLTAAGNTTRYRLRVRLFETITMKTHVLGWDARFIYLSQSMWRGDECTSQMLLRSAIIDASRSRSGLVAPATVAAAMGLPPESPPLPDYVRAWSEAEATRPWPPTD